uniref:Uncharacterized protein n=1 Tax=Aureoumbra lagunensis TaxID=44058 RepID=A0A7S3K3F5_9STRA
MRFQYIVSLILFKMKIICAYINVNTMSFRSKLVQHKATFSSSHEEPRGINNPSLESELESLLSVSINAGLAARHVEDDDELKARKRDADEALCEAVWERIDMESQGGSNISNWWPAITDDFAGVLLEAYIKRCQCSLKRVPIALVAAAAASAAMVGEVELAFFRLEAILVRSKDGWTPQRLGSRLRSKVITALCEAPGRTEACLELALVLLDPDSTKNGIGSNAWLSQRARRSVLDAMLRQARADEKMRNLRDDEATLLGSGGLETTNLPRITSSDDKRRLTDILPNDELDLIFVPIKSSTRLSQAEALARGAVRGRSKREVLARVAALAYHAERRPARSLDAVSKALGRASDGCAPATAAADVLRAVLREALIQGDSEAVESLLEELALRQRARSSDNDDIDQSATEQYDMATLDIVLWAAAEDGDALGAARVLEARRRGGGGVSGKQDQALALALRACVSALAAGRMQLDEVFYNLGVDNLNQILNSPSRLVRLAGVQLAAVTMDQDEDGFFERATNRDGSRATLAALRALEIFAMELDTTQVSFKTQRASRRAAQLLREYYYYISKLPPAVVCDTAMRIFAVEGATNLAIELYKSRPASDANARYGLLRALSLAPDAIEAPLNQNDENLGPWSQLALAVAAARSGDPGPAINTWRRLEEEQSSIRPAARAALLASLVSHPCCVAAGARLLDQLEKQKELPKAQALRSSINNGGLLGQDDERLLEQFLNEEPRNQEDEGQRVRAALAKRLGNARNWAAAGRKSVVIPGAEQMVVGETAYARLASAMVRSREAKNAREAVVLLSRYGVRVDLARIYLDDAAPRKGRLYKALFGSAASQRDATNTQAEIWYDARADRTSAPLNRGRDRKQTRETVVATATGLSSVDSTSYVSEASNGGRSRHVAPSIRRAVRQVSSTAKPPASKILARLPLHTSASSSSAAHFPTITLAARFDDEDVTSSATSSSS